MKYPKELKLDGDFNMWLPSEEIVIWQPVYHASSYTFENIRPEPLTKAFLDYIIKFDNYATKRGFYEYINREYKTSNNCMFFAAIKQAGIVREEHGHFRLGPNFEAYVERRLKRGIIHPNGNDNEKVIE